MRRRHDPLIEMPSICVHFWLCGEMDQLVVRAVCKKCGERAEFIQAAFPWTVSALPRQFCDSALRWAKAADEMGRRQSVPGEY